METRITRLEEWRTTATEKIGHLESACYGTGGNPGVVDDVRALKIWRHDMLTDQREREKERNRVLGSIIVGLLLLVANLLVSLWK